MEIWKKIPGYPNYEISNSGRIKRIKRGRHTQPGKILKPILNKDGYYVACLVENKLSQTMTIHYLVMIAFLPPKPEHYDQARHLDGDRLNNNVSNLRWGNAQENADDRGLHKAERLKKKQ